MTRVKTMTNKQKKRCNFYGCTIPAGIAHHHPLNGPVMRDPSAPLDDVERAELEMYRAIDRNVDLRGIHEMQNKNIDMIVSKPNHPIFDLHGYFRSEPWPQPDFTKRRTFSQQVGTIAVWIVAAAGSLIIVGYAALEAVTALGWAS